MSFSLDGTSTERLPGNIYKEETRWNFKALKSSHKPRFCLADAGNAEFQRLTCQSWLCKLVW